MSYDTACILPFGCNNSVENAGKLQLAHKQKERSGGVGRAKVTYCHLLIPGTG